MLYTIKKELGFGTVTAITATQNQNAHYRYTVSKLKHIKLLVFLFNGNLLLTKAQIRFVKWLECFNNLRFFSNLSTVGFALKNLEVTPFRETKKVVTQDIFVPIPLKPFVKEARARISLESGWLAGFSDAEAGFYCSLSANKRFATGFRERYKFYIVQKGERWLLERIGQVIEEIAWKKLGLETKPGVWGKSDYISTYKSKENTHRLEIHRFELLNVLIDYFDKYPLLSKQQLIFVRWRRSFLFKDQYRVTALHSEKGMRRYKRIFASIGKIRDSLNILN